MKNICFTAGSLQDHEAAKPLQRFIRNHEDLKTASILSAVHNHHACRIRYRLTEAEGFQIDEQTEVCIEKPFSGQIPGDTGYLRKMLAQCQPDITLTFGSSFFAYQAAVASSLEDIPVAHISGDTAHLGTWEKNYACGIGKIAVLHFTETMTYRKQVIDTGEHPDTVFQVGSLYQAGTVEKITAMLKSFSRPDIRKKSNPGSSRKTLTIGRFK